MKVKLLFLLMLIICFTGTVWASQPMDVIQGPVDQVVNLLSDPEYQDSDRRATQREKIRGVINPMFDYTEVAKRALVRNWRIFSPDERKEFTGVFSEFLANTYLSKIEGSITDLKVVYVGQKLISDTKATVRTRIIRETVETPLDYSLKLKNGNWRVYDVKVEGVSLVKNYRTQFKKILMNETPAQLIDRLRQKLHAQQSDGAVE